MDMRSVAHRGTIAAVCFFLLACNDYKVGCTPNKPQETSDKTEGAPPTVRPDPSLAANKLVPPQSASASATPEPAVSASASASASSSASAAPSASASAAPSASASAPAAKASAAPSAAASAAPKPAPSASK